MKILWFTNQLFPEAAQSLGLPPPVRGGWLFSLGHALNESKSIKLGVASVVENPCWQKKEIQGIIHYSIPMPKNRDFEITLKPGPSLLNDCKKVIEEFVPDLVHVHGTEYFYGSLTLEGIIRCPAVISIQGLIGECAKVYFGGMGFREIMKCQSLYGLVRGFGILFEKRRFDLRAKWMENKILRGNYNFIGRTLWDKSYVHSINPQARYYHCDELLRTPFYNTFWDYKHIRKHSIFTTSASYPLKGFHLLLKAVAILKKEFPDVTLRVTDGLQGPKSIWRSYATFLYELINSLGLQNCVFPLGMLPAEQMAKEMSMAHALVAPSLIENSPNSLLEGMLVGTPCVASSAGGMTTIINNGENALGFPIGDHVMLATCLRQIFLDPVLANRLSKAAQVKARERHAKDTIVNTMLEIYQDVQKKGNKPL